MIGELVLVTAALAGPAALLLTLLAIAALIVIGLSEAEAAEGRLVSPRGAGQRP